MHGQAHCALSAGLPPPPHTHTHAHPARQQDFATAPRQRDMAGLRQALGEREEQAEAAIRDFGEDVKRHPHHH